MRDLNFKHAGLLIMLSIMLFACNDKYDPNIERGTIISDLLISNGGPEGKVIYESMYYPEDNMFIFENVSAETDLENIKFAGTISVGAAPEFKTYNFIEKNPQIVKVTTERGMANTMYT